MRKKSFFFKKKEHKINKKELDFVRKTDCRNRVLTKRQSTTKLRRGIRLEIVELKIQKKRQNLYMRSTPFLSFISQ